MPDYGSASYWDERYASMDDEYDWYQDYSTLKDFLMPYMIDKSAEVLIPGCGSSTLGASLYNHGYKNITNIDVSQVVINQMSDRYCDKEEMEFNVMDAREMSLMPDGCFDVVIDKGLFDALLCSENRGANIKQLLSELFRVLKPGGVYLLISHGAPASRMQHITTRSQFQSIEHTIIPRPYNSKMGVKDETKKPHYIYACRR